MASTAMPSGKPQKSQSSIRAFFKKGPAGPAAVSETRTPRCLSFQWFRSLCEKAQLLCLLCRGPDLHRARPLKVVLSVADGLLQMSLALIPFWRRREPGSEP